MSTIDDPGIDLLDELGSNPQLLQTVLTPPIAFNPVFVDIAGSVTAGLMLSVLIELPQLEQWNSLDMEQIMRETRMTPGEVRGARQRLRDGKLLLERRTGFPAVTQFMVDFGRIKVELIRLARERQQLANQADQLGGIHGTSVATAALQAAGYSASSTTSGAARVASRLH